MCKLSIIIPIYKVEDYIERCATSLFLQTLSDVEYIFINDKTPDKSMDVLDRVISKFPHLSDSIHIIEHSENKGLAATRITGLQFSQGEYVAFCDSDDWIDPEMYVQLYKTATDENADMVYCNYIAEHLSKTIRVDIPKVTNIKDYINSLLLGTIPSFSCLRIFKRELLSDHIFELYQVGVDMWEDVLMNIRLYPYLKRIAYNPIAGYHYNQCNGNAYTAIWSNKSLSNIQDVLRLVIQTIDKDESLQFPLSCFKIGTYYSILSHTSLIDLINTDCLISRQDMITIWKHPAMPFHNKLFLFLLGFRMNRTAFYYLKLKRAIKTNLQK